MEDQLMRLLHDDALLVVDVQRDFLPNGALPVPEGDVRALAGLH